MCDQNDVEFGAERDNRIPVHRDGDVVIECFVQQGGVAKWVSINECVQLVRKDTLKKLVDMEVRSMDEECGANWRGHISEDEFKASMESRYHGSLRLERLVGARLFKVAKRKVINLINA